MRPGRHCQAGTWRPGQAVNRRHLVATKLPHACFVQQGLSEPLAGRALPGACLKREVNARLGWFTLRSGSTLPLYEVYRDDVQAFDVCEIHGKTCF